jgi:hypothetical protein
MSSTGPQRSTPCSRWYPEPLRGEVRFDRLDEPTGESTSELLHSHDLDATRFPSRGFHARHVARKSGVHHNCAASTKDQADPNQLHSFVTSKPTTCPRPYCS